MVVLQQRPDLMQRAETLLLHHYIHMLKVEQLWLDMQLMQKGGRHPHWVMNLMHLDSKLLLSTIVLMYGIQAPLTTIILMAMAHSTYSLHRMTFVT